MARKVYKAIIADDNKQFLNLFKELLTDKGVDVIECVTNGSDTVKRALELQPDILFTDIIMGDVDGIEVIEKIKEDRYGRNIRICVVSSLFSDDAIRQATRAGAGFYFTKPVNIERVMSWVHNTFDVEKLRFYEEIEDKEADLLATQFLNMFSMPATINGFRYLKKSAIYILHQPGMIHNVIHGLYPRVAKDFYTTPSCVERSIRHSLKLIWQKGGFVKAKNEYGIDDFDDCVKRPTSSRFIKFIAENIKMKLDEKDSKK